MVISDLIDLPSGVDTTGKLNPVLLGAFPTRGPQYTHNTVILLFIDLFVCVRVPVYMCYDFTAPLFRSVAVVWCCDTYAMDYRGQELLAVAPT